MYSLQNISFFLSQLGNLFECRCKRTCPWHLLVNLKLEKIHASPYLSVFIPQNFKKTYKVKTKCGR